MTDRDKLIELHEEAGVEWDYYVDECINEGEVPSKTYDEFHADYLLANGVIVPPVPICTTVYEIRAKGKGPPRGRYCNYSVTTNYSLRNAIERGLELYIKPKEFVKTDMTRWNKTVFLTKEDAMKKLKELEKDE